MRGTDQLKADQSIQFRWKIFHLWEKPLELRLSADGFFDRPPG